MSEIVCELTWSNLSKDVKLINSAHAQLEMVVLEKKIFKEFYQFRLNLLIKISYIPDSTGSKVMAKKKIVPNLAIFCLRVKIYTSHTPKTSKTIAEPFL